MTAARGYSEDGRAAFEILVGAVALLLRWITPHEAMVVVGVVLAFSVGALPYIAPSLLRPLRGHRHLDPGLISYAGSVLLLLMLLPDRLDIVASTWGIMAAGHGMASIAGRRVRGARIPSFVFFGGGAGALLGWWCVSRVIPPPFPWFTIWMPFAAACAAAAAETLPIRLDANVSVPASAAAVLWTTSLVNGDLVTAALAHAAAVLPTALAVNVAVATVGYFAGTVTAGGALCGAAIGICVLVTVGWNGWALLLTTFAVAVIASRIGLGRKTTLGIAEPRKGRRGIANALANTGVATVAGMLSVMSYATDGALVAFVAALTAGGSDTVASEIGKAWGRPTFLVTTLQRVSAGTPGAMSLAGTVAGLCAAVLLSGLAITLHLVPRSALLAVIVAAIGGSLIESLLAATLEHKAVLDNDVLNLLNTASAALIAVWILVTFK